MKPKYKTITKNDATNWIFTANLFAKSLIKPITAINEYNTLSPQERLKIKQLFSKYDDIRQKKIPSTEVKSSWEISVMVDSHIIATEYNINPLTAAMCISPPCLITENVIIK